jgi:hypothetical protein
VEPCQRSQEHGQVGHSIKTSGIQQVVRLEEGPNKIECDLTVLQQWNKPFSRSLVGFLHVADQQV